MIEVLKTPSGHRPLKTPIPRLYTLQVASFINKDNADYLAAKLSHIVDNVYIVLYKTGETTYYRVRVGTFKSREEATREGERLTREGYNILITKYE